MTTGVKPRTSLENNLYIYISLTQSKDSWKRRKKTVGVTAARLPPVLFPFPSPHLHRVSWSATCTSAGGLLQLHSLRDSLPDHRPCFPRASCVCELPARLWSAWPVNDLPLWSVSQITCLFLCAGSQTVWLGYLLLTWLKKLYLWTHARYYSLSKELCGFWGFTMLGHRENSLHFHPACWFLFRLKKTLIGNLWMCAALGC